MRRDPTPYINTDTDPAVGWVVLWNNQSGDSNSVTCWAGQYFSDSDPEIILTMWLLREETQQNQNWASTLVGEDVFYRSPAQARDRVAVSTLRRPAHPVK